MRGASTKEGIPLYGRVVLASSGPVPVLYPLCSLGSFRSITTPPVPSARTLLYPVPLSPAHGRLSLSLSLSSPLLLPLTLPPSCPALPSSTSHTTKSHSLSHLPLPPLLPKRTPSSRLPSWAFSRVTSATQAPLLIWDTRHPVPFRDYRRSNIPRHTPFCHTTQSPLL